MLFSTIAFIPSLLCECLIENTILNNFDHNYDHNLQYVYIGRTIETTIEKDMTIVLE